MSSRSSNRIVGGPSEGLRDRSWSRSAPTSRRIIILFQGRRRRRNAFRAPVDNHRRRRRRRLPRLSLSKIVSFSTTTHGVNTTNSVFFSSVFSSAAVVAFSRLTALKARRTRTRLTRLARRTIRGSVRRLPSYGPVDISNSRALRSFCV